MRRQIVDCLDHGFGVGLSNVLRQDFQVLRRPVLTNDFASVFPAREIGVIGTTEEIEAVFAFAAAITERLRMGWWIELGEFRLIGKLARRNAFTFEEFS